MHTTSMKHGIFLSFVAVAIAVVTTSAEATSTIRTVTSAFSAFVLVQDPAATCGDGIVDTGEDCDDGNIADGDCCAADCTFEAADAPCGDPSDSLCDLPDSCDGTGACIENFAADTVVCRPAVDECDTEEMCDGLGACPIDLFASADTPCGDDTDSECDNPDTCDGAGVCNANLEADTVVCRPAVDACDVEELCDGAGACPVDAFAAADTACGDDTDSECDNPDTCDGAGLCMENLEADIVVCRPAVDECDVEELCDGLGNCPADGMAAEGTPCGDDTDTDCDNPDSCDGAGLCLANNEADDTDCSDEMFCNGEETCLAGECVDNEDPCDEATEICDEEMDVCVLSVQLDIKPGSCPNRVNRDSQGVVTVALIGSDAFNVSEVDIDSLALSRSDGVGATVTPMMGPPGPHVTMDDIATAFDGVDCECHDLEGDGIMDLNMKFKTPRLNDMLQLGAFGHKDAVEFLLTGQLLDGTPFEASDCIEVLHSRGKAPRRRR